MDDRYSRRIVLKAGGLAFLSIAAGSVSGPSFLHRAARATTTSAPFKRRKVLVTIFQRGAMDGLMAVPPLSDTSLEKLRPQLFMGASKRLSEERTVLDLGNGYGLHPALGRLEPLFKEGRLAVVHGVGSPDPTRSHFDAQDYMETGTPGRKGTASGWLNRVAGELGHEASPLRSVAMTSAMPRSLYGPESAVAVTDLRRFEVSAPGPTGSKEESSNGFESLYQATSSDLLRETGGEAFEAVHRLDEAAVSGYRPTRGANYPRSPLGSSLKQIAFLVKSNLGLEVAFAESGGWDTHVRQGTEEGSFARRARDLADSISAFWTDLGTYQEDVTLMTMTEFGRTVAENGSAGTDHGHGSALFVLGNQVHGGRVLGELPRLETRNLYEGRDLPVTTDFRAVFSGVAQQHMGIDRSVELFPGWDGKALSILRG